MFVILVSDLGTLFKCTSIFLTVFLCSIGKKLKYEWQKAINTSGHFTLSKKKLVLGVVACTNVEVCRGECQSIKINQNLYSNESVWADLLYISKKEFP